MTVCQAAGLCKGWAGRPSEHGCALQWEDVCRVAAVRYVPPLALLTAALLGGGMLGAALPLPWLTALIIAVVSCLTPVPSQVHPCCPMRLS